MKLLKKLFPQALLFVTLFLAVMVDNSLAQREVYCGARNLLVRNNSTVVVEVGVLNRGSGSTPGIVKPKKRKVFKRAFPQGGVYNVVLDAISAKPKYDISEARQVSRSVVINSFATPIKCKKPIKVRVNNKALNVKKSKEKNIDFGGSWSTSFGPIVFAQFDDDTVSATYFWSGGGTLSGEVKRRVMSGSYVDGNGDGTFRIKASKNGKRFRGSYTTSDGDSGPWTGSR